VGQNSDRCLRAGVRHNRADQYFSIATELWSSGPLRADAYKPLVRAADSRLVVDEFGLFDDPRRSASQSTSRDPPIPCESDARPIAAARCTLHPPELRRQGPVAPFQVLERRGLRAPQH